MARPGRWLDHPRASLTILGLGLLLRAALMLFLPQQPFSDAEYYVLRAFEMLDGGGLTEKGVPTAFWPPGQTFLVAGTMLVFGKTMLGPMLANLAAAAGIIAGIAWLGTHVAGSRRAGLAGALLYAVYPAHIAYAGQPFSETSSTAISMAALVLMLCGRHKLVWLVLSGLIWGVATLFRAQLVAFPFGALIAMALLYPDFGWRRALAGGLTLYVALFAVLMPWTLRNQREFGAPVMVSTNGGVGLYMGASPEATGDHVAWGLEVWARTGIPQDDRIRRQVEVDRAFNTLARQWIAENPGRYLALMPKKALLLWAKDSDGFWGLKKTYPEREGVFTAVQWGNQLFYFAILLLALPCLWAGLPGWLGKPGGQEREQLILFLMPAFVTLTAIIFTGQVRYHFPAMPFLCLAAAWTVLEWRNFQTKKAVTG